MSVESGGALGALIYKVGLIKLLGFGSALIGAGIMAATRPPKSRKEMFYQAATALGCSFLFGGLAVQWFMNWQVWAVGSLEAIVAIHGLLGAVSWGIFGALAVLREKFSKDPIQVAKDVKDIL